MTGEGKDKAREVPIIDIIVKYCALTLAGKLDDAREFLRTNRSRLPELAEHYVEVRESGIMKGVEVYEARLDMREGLVKEVMAEEGTAGCSR
jgi:hypothetical protein